MQVLNFCVIRITCDTFVKGADSLLATNEGISSMGCTDYGTPFSLEKEGLSDICDSSMDLEIALSQRSGYKANTDSIHLRHSERLDSWKQKVEW